MLISRMLISCMLAATSAACTTSPPDPPRDTAPAPVDAQTDRSRKEAASTPDPAPGSATPLCAQVASALPGWAQFTPLEPIPDDPVGMSDTWEAPRDAAVETCAANLYKGEDPLLIGVFTMPDAATAQAITRAVIVDVKDQRYPPEATFVPVPGGEMLTGYGAPQLWASTGRHVVIMTTSGPAVDLLEQLDQVLDD